jgi:hypothetical protein
VPDSLGSEEALGPPGRLGNFVTDSLGSEDALGLHDGLDKPFGPGLTCWCRPWHQHVILIIQLRPITSHLRIVGVALGIDMEGYKIIARTGITRRLVIKPQVPVERLEHGKLTINITTDGQRISELLKTESSPMV